MKRSVIIAIIFYVILIFVIQPKEEYSQFYDSYCDVLFQIISNGDQRDDGTFYICKVISINGEDTKFKKYIRIKVKEDQNELDYGNIYLCNLKIKEPDISRNPGNFSYKKYLLTLNVSATATIEEISKLEYKESKSNNVIKELGINANKSIVKNIRELLPSGTSKIAESVLMGNKQYLDNDLKEVFSSAGIAHFMAVSGAHIAIYLYPISGFLKKIRIKKQKRYIAEIICVIFYMSVTGFGIPVVRAGILIIMNRIAFLLKRDNDRVLILLYTFLILLIINPYNLYSIGMQLSFLAAISIEYIKPKIIKNIGKIKILDSLSENIKESISVFFAVQIGTLPVLINNFNMPVAVTLFANLICSPLISMIMMTGMPMIVFKLINIDIIAGLLSYNVYIIGYLIESTAKIFSEISQIKVLDIVHMMPLSIIMYYIFLVLLITNKNRKFSKILPIMVVFSLYVNSVYIPSDLLYITMIDVGQGDSIFISSPSGKTYLIDCGSSNVENVSEYRIIPYLNSRNVKYLDYVIVSHSDNDHVSGIFTLMDEVKIKYLIMPDILLKDDIYMKIINSARENNIEIIYFSKGDYITDGNIKILCMHPKEKSDLNDLNSLSMVLNLEYKNFTALFTGDLDGSAEKDIYSDLGEINFLKVAHHGSKNSTFKEFLDITKPDAVAISCGENNVYGHPDEELTDRLSNYTDSIYITSLNGAIMLKTNGNETKIKEYIP